MKIEDLLVNIASSILAAGVVVVISRTIQQRRMVPIFLCIVILGLIWVGMRIFSPQNFFDETKIQVDGILFILMASAIIIFILLFWKDSFFSSERRLMSSFKSMKKTTKSRLRGWNWETNAFNLDTNSKDQIYSLSLGSLPELVFTGGYGPEKLTPLNVGEKFAKQITIYHIVDQEEYISWIDALYWATLRRLSEMGLSVKIYVFKKDFKNQSFLKYMKSISGPQVTIDDEVFDRFQIMPQTVTTETSDLQEQENETINGNIHNKTKYIKITAFARLLPLLLGCQHIWILVWESYYTKYFKNGLSISTKDVKIHTENLTKEGFQDTASLSTQGFETAFLLVPTSMGIDDDGKNHTINPKYTFHLGRGDLFEVVYDSIKVLPNNLLKCIAREILHPLLPL